MILQLITCSYIAENAHIGYIYPVLSTSTLMKKLHEKNIILLLTGESEIKSGVVII